MSSTITGDSCSIRILKPLIHSPFSSLTIPPPPPFFRPFSWLPSVFSLKPFLGFIHPTRCILDFVEDATPLPCPQTLVVCVARLLPSLFYFKIRVYIRHYLCQLKINLSKTEKMSVIDLLTRVESICQKYDKYDVVKQKDSNVAGDDAFARLYASVEEDIEAAIQKAETASSEKSRASAVAINAEIRRTKARLLDEVPKLQRLAVKRVKGISAEEFSARNDLVLALPDKIQAIPDGASAPPKQTGAWGSSAPRSEIKFDSDGRFDNEYFQQTEESSQFRQEYEMRKIRQDQGLDVIAEGLSTLKNMAQDMNEEMDRQVPLMDEIDTKIDKASTDLKNTNVRLKHTVNQLRSSRNFCIDIVLLCVILGIAAYLYNVLR